MDLNRNHYFVIGLVLFLLGLQFRYVSAIQLNERSSKFIEKRFGSSSVAQAQAFPGLFATQAPTVHRVIRPPRWLGWCLMSVGGVLFVFSLSMKKPGS